MQQFWDLYKLPSLTVVVESFDDEGNKVNLLMGGQ